MPSVADIDLFAPRTFPKEGMSAEEAWLRSVETAVAASAPIPPLLIDGRRPRSLPGPSAMRFRSCIQRMAGSPCFMHAGSDCWRAIAAAAGAPLIEWLGQGNYAPLYTILENAREQQGQAFTFVLALLDQVPAERLREWIITAPSVCAATSSDHPVNWLERMTSMRILLGLHDAGASMACTALEELSARLTTLADGQPCAWIESINQSIQAMALLTGRTLPWWHAAVRRGVLDESAGTLRDPAPSPLFRRVTDLWRPSWTSVCTLVVNSLQWLPTKDVAAARDWLMDPVSSPPEAVWPRAVIAEALATDDRGWLHLRNAIATTQPARGSGSPYYSDVPPAEVAMERWDALRTALLQQAALAPADAQPVRPRRRA